MLQGGLAAQKSSTNRLAGENWRSLRTYQRKRIRICERTIALDIGFGHHPYFNRAFRRRYGTTPSELRAAAKFGD